MRLLPLFLLLAATPLHAAPPEQWLAAPQPWDRSLGSHRVILQVPNLSPGTRAVSASIEWRRPDPAPEKKAVIIHDLKSGKPIPNVRIDHLSAESTQLTFEPLSGPGEYAVYFLPVQLEGGAFPVGKYLPPASSADAAWLKDHAPSPAAAASPIRWEAVSAHDAWTAAEVIASAAELAALRTASGNLAAAIVPKDARSFRMNHTLSRDLALAGTANTPIRLSARPGESLVFPVVIWSPNRDLSGVTAAFSGPATWLNPASIVCLSTHRTDWNGIASVVPVSVPRATPKALWFSVPIPNEPGSTSLTLNLPLPDGSPATRTLTIEIEASGPPIADHGDSDPQSLSRLRWLNSSTAVDDEPVKGYSPLEVDGHTIRCLGRSIDLGDDGLPVQIRSHFNKAITTILPQPTLHLLHQPVAFSVSLPSTDPDKKPRSPFRGSGFKLTRTSPGVVTWSAQLSSSGITGQLSGHMESDGSIRYRVALAADTNPVAVDGIHLDFPRSAASTTHILGLQQETGTLAPADALTWHWEVARKHQDSLWLGAVNGGLRVQLKADNYVRPSVNIHYQRRPLNNPPSWNAANKGTITLSPEQNGSRTLTGSSGPLTLQPNQPLHFDFDLLITPFHTLRTAEQWSDRYYHTGQVPKDVDKYLDAAKAASASVVNIHQGNWLNPYINYPFLTADRLAAFAAAAHQRGMRAKYYYTVRELSNWCPELFAFRSMDSELLMSGTGGGHPWGEEHLHGNYWQAWFEPGTQDVSFLTQPMSRFHNYYIEGLRWLCQNAGCDGIYLDDIAYDRSIMLRARKVLDRFSPRGGLIDLHSWNEFHEGGAWAHCPNIFMDSMPFVDRLWFGEGHHYSGPSADHFLVELSGIPFGLMGEMLEGGGNPWLGLVFGTTGRLGWGGNPSEVWKLWDDFSVQNAEFTGWWAAEECPVLSSDPTVKASVWKKPGASMVAVANFSSESKPASLTINWQALGLDPTKAKLFFPALAQIRQKAAWLSPDRLPVVRPHSGMVFIIDHLPHDVAAPPSAASLGPILLEDSFSARLDPSWKPVFSPNAKTSGTIDSGLVLQMPANLHGFLERKLPPDAAAVSTRIWQDPKDEAQQWGPGIALIWPDGQSLRTNIRKDGRLTVSHNGSENLDASISSRAPVEFTLSWDKEFIRIAAAGPAMGDLPEEIARFPRSQFPAQPALVRLGKMPSSTSPSDFSEQGPPGFNRIEWFRLHGPKP